MGIIKAAVSTVGGALADQWLEVIEPEKMDNETIASFGVKVRKNDRRGSNKRGTEDVISNGSIIHVPENAYMLLVDGGNIIAVTEEAGYYEVENSKSPSIFFQSNEGISTAGNTNNANGSVNRPGGIRNTIKDSFERFKFGGVTPYKQKVVYINKQEIVGIRFGTKNPVPYTDRVLVPGRVVPCKVTSFGQYSIKINDPILFYMEVCSKTGNDVVGTNNLASQYIDEFLGAYSTALARLSMENIMVTDIPIRQSELAKHMADILDDDWLQRGIAIESVGIASISYDERTNELLDKYGNDSILLDPNARAARMAAGYAAGIEAAGSNANGAMMGFAGMSMGMNAGNAMGMNQNQMNQQQPYNQYNQQPPSQNSTTLNTNKTDDGWTCTCGNKLPESANFCTNCGGQKPIDDSKWTCSCGSENSTMFCPNCGSKKPDNTAVNTRCKNCDFEAPDANNLPVFCPNCGNKFS